MAGRSSNIPYSVSPGRLTARQKIVSFMSSYQTETRCGWPPIHEFYLVLSLNGSKIRHLLTLKMPETRFTTLDS
ncbi:hypothetical protein WG66_008006 [Moniliophthora roreri]|nr:hypothetical protein WG66_008006 [Moniliophthora roreri]